MPSACGTYIDDLFRFLKKEMCLKHSIKLKTKAGWKNEGDYFFHPITRGVNQGVFYHLIVLNRGLSFDAAINALLHEFAHAVYCEQDTSKNWRVVHSKEWGIAYSKVYQTYEKFLNHIDAINEKIVSQRKKKKKAL